MSYKSDKLKKALEAKGYTNVKVWYVPIGAAMEMCGNSGGWMYSWDERTEDCLSYNLDLSLEVINRMPKVEPDESFQDHLCVCGHKRHSHSKIGCEVFMNEFLGDCPCSYFSPEFSE